MSAAAWILYLIGIAAYFFASLAFGYYVSVCTRRGLAVGAGWSFERQVRPALFWIQVMGALVICIFLAMQALGATYALLHLSRLG